MRKIFNIKLIILCLLLLSLSDSVQATDSNQESFNPKRNLPPTSNEEVIKKQKRCHSTDDTQVQTIEDQTSIVSSVPTEATDTSPVSRSPPNSSLHNETEKVNDKEASAEVSNVSKYRLAVMRKDGQVEDDQLTLDQAFEYFDALRNDEEASAEIRNMPKYMQAVMRKNGQVQDEKLTLDQTFDLLCEVLNNKEPNTWVRNPSKVRLAEMRMNGQVQDDKLKLKLRS